MRVGPDVHISASHIFIFLLSLVITQRCEFLRQEVRENCSHFIRLTVRLRPAASTTFARKFQIFTPKFTPLSTHIWIISYSSAYFVQFMPIPFQSRLIRIQATNAL